MEITRRSFIQGLAALGSRAFMPGVGEALPFATVTDAASVMKRVAIDSADDLEIIMSVCQMAFYGPIKEPTGYQDYPARYNTFKARTALIKIFDFIAPEGTEVTDETIETLASQVDNAAFPVTMSELVDGLSWLKHHDQRRQVYDSLIAEFMQDTETEMMAGRIANADPHLSPHHGGILMDAPDLILNAKTVADKSYRLPDPHLLTEVNFASEFGFWPDQYPKDGPSAAFLQQFRQSPMGRYMEYANDARDYFGIAPERTFTDAEISNIQDLRMVFGQADYDPETHTWSVDDLSRIQTSFDIKPRNDAFKKAPFMATTIDFMPGDQISEGLEPGIHTPIYQVHIDFHANQHQFFWSDKRHFIVKRLKEIFGNCTEADWGNLVIHVPMATGDPEVGLDRIYVWQRDPDKMERDVLPDRNATMSMILSIG